MSGFYGKPQTRDIPVFKSPVEVRLALQMAGRVMKFDSARVMSEKMKWGRDLRTFIEAFKNALSGQTFSPEFDEYTQEIQLDVNSVFAIRTGMAA